MKTLTLSVLTLVLLGYSHSPGFTQDQDSNKTDEKIYTGKEVDRKAVVLSKPEPTFTDAARRQNVMGVVELSAVFAASGEVKIIEVRKRLPGGLTEKAIAAAHQITFTPAMKDGHSVSQRIMLEYWFNRSDRIIHGQHFPKLYYDERCQSYSNIAENNMVFFSSEKEAKKAGYRKSKLCP